MLRNRNPFSPLMAGSYDGFQFRGADCVTADLDALLEARLPGKTSVTRALDGDSEPITTITFAHESIDAFGSLYLLNACGVRAIGAGRAGSRGEEQGRIATLPFRHAWLVTEGRGHTQGQSLTQWLLAAILTRIHALQETPVAVPVALDDLSRLNERSYRGNSFVMLQMQGHAFLELTRRPRAEWKETLLIHARRLLYLESIGRELPTFEAGLFFTSCLGLERYAWAPAATPERMVMVAVPSSRERATLVIWSTGAVHGIGLSTGDDHPLLAAWPTLRDAWAEALLEPAAFGGGAR